MRAMRTLVALLRGVNVGGARRLAMSDLVRLCASCGFRDARTYIQSGNVIFKTTDTASAAAQILDRAVSQHMGAPVGVLVRDCAQLSDVLRHNPFPGAAPAQVVVFFAPGPLNEAEFDGVTGPAGERVVARGHELYVHYPEGQGRSKLRLPKSLGAATARNINTVGQLLERCSA